MHREGFGEGLRGVPVFGVAHIMKERFAVVRVGAVEDDLVGALDGILAPEVGDALLGNDDVDGMSVSLNAHQ